MIHYGRELNVFQITSENVIGADESTNVFQSTKEYIRPMLYKVNHGQKYEDFTKIL